MKLQNRTHHPLASTMGRLEQSKITDPQTRAHIQIYHHTCQDHGLRESDEKLQTSSLQQLTSLYNTAC
ncbi:hypothetical protein NC653_025605 [Populus alba x Populus x berolinensis]|uniref:Uncharacterized protein n=1 Tax=Populus alba x Populus x berolinensis TaxID=444605 RepID=A0AAD6MBM5_9ROSI|nr:hypothetical protein NC653_025605 [Populus alba x Populus x berolinensis]